MQSELHCEQARSGVDQVGRVARHPMAYEMPPDKNIWGRKTTTFNEVVAGNRTSTTRGWGNALPKIGEVIEFFDSSKRRAVQVRVTKVSPVPSNPTAEWVDQWTRKEGWNADYARLKRYWHGHQVEFELARGECV